MSTDAPATDPTGTTDGPPRWLQVLVAVVIIGCVVLRFLSTSPLWLDESQTVDIAGRSLPHLFSALKEDGSPPLYYVLLHGWMAVFGTSSFAIRSLSGICSVLSLPLIAVAARRYGVAPGSRWPAVLLLATSPFAVRYATEARMYALVVLLTLLALLAYERVWTLGGAWWIAAASVATGALVLTQYWALFLLMTAGAGALIAIWRGVSGARRLLVPMVIGGILFLPWLPTFAYQSAHTGAPWGGPPGVDTPVLVLGSWAGIGFAGPLIVWAYYILAALALAGRHTVAGGMTFSRPIRRQPLLLLVLGVGAVTLGTIASEISSSAYDPRYSSISLAPLLLMLAAGFGPLTPRVRRPAVALVCVLGLASAVLLPWQLRTQAAQVANAIKAAGPHDLVVFCPDQLGPAVHRLAPDAGDQVVYPTFGSSAMVDWVDYASRNEKANPVAFARAALARAQGHSIWFVYAYGYRTFNGACQQLLTSFSIARGQPRTVVKAEGRSFERDSVAEFRP